VSVGLVQHHFGTKDGLRAACDEMVLRMLHLKTNALDEGRLHQPQVLSTLMAMAPLVQCYVSRAMVDDSPGMATLTNEVMDRGEAFLTGQQPGRFLPGSERTRDAAAVMTAVNTSIMVMQPTITRRMGIEPWTNTAVVRVGSAMLDVFEAFAEFVDSDTWRNLRSAVDAYSERGGTG
jgi:AcrR family transcriptional regulator